MGSQAEDYYQILGVDRRASPREIKSAYRRKARRRHPDLNGNTEEATRDFALLALAYRVLGDPQERARYDARRERASGRGGFAGRTGQVRSRRVAPGCSPPSRADRVVDTLLAADRRETLALQRAVYPLVVLLVSTFFASTLRPRMFHLAGVTPRALVVALFLIGLWHLRARLRSSVDYFVGAPDAAAASRLRAYVSLAAGLTLSLASGFVVGEHLEQYVILKALPLLLDASLRPEFLLYPPIAVLAVDAVHEVALKLDL